MSDETTNVIDITEAQIKKAKNLRPYKDKTDEEIRALLSARAINRQPKERTNKSTDSYDKKFQVKFNELSKEFSLDMNNSNDVEYLRMLVRLLIQNENLSKDIDEMQSQETRQPEDYRNLKNMTDAQSTTVRAINDIQDKLGISRKQRKEKQVDDIPQFINGLLERAKEEFDLKTTTIMCPKCQIELMRTWLNFPHLDNKIQATLICWKCEEKILYAR